MFIGHFAVAFAAKPAAPRVSLGTLFLACELVDLLWPACLLLGIEAVAIRPGTTAFTPLEFIHYPWTHSLAMGMAWGGLSALVYWIFRKRIAGRSGDAILVGAVVVSHWLLDAVAHRPDLALFPGGEARIGFGLWNSLPGTLLVECAMFFAALAYYLRRTRPLDRAGAWGLWGLVVFLLAAYAGAAFGPPPPSVPAIAWVGLAGGLLTGVWGYWLERHRAVRVE